MTKIYKVVILNHPLEGSNEVFAIKPYLESFDSFKEEIFIRMPELKSQTLKLFYEGKCSAILSNLLIFFFCKLVFALLVMRT